MNVEIEYTWDPKKSRANLRKHGVSFEQAREIFDDASHVVMDDWQDGGELRCQAIGLTRSGALLLLVAFVDRTKTDDQTENIVLHLISARKANHYETTIYKEHSQA